jgi:hypothetical protein
VHEHGAEVAGNTAEVDTSEHRNPASYRPLLSSPG